MRDALKHWVPGTQLVSLAVEQDSAQLTLRLRVCERERETTAVVDVSIER